MPIAISPEQSELASSFATWAAGQDGIGLARAAEQDPAEAFDKVAAAVAEMGIAGIAVPESLGGGGGAVPDLGIVLEATAGALVPGPLLGTCAAGLLARRLGLSALAGDVASGRVRVGIAPAGGLRRTGGRLVGSPGVVLDGAGVDRVLVGTAEDEWFLVPAAHAGLTPQPPVDLGRRFASAEVDVAEGVTQPVPGCTGALVRRTLLTLAAAEASGVARWCLDTAVAYAGVREQFGRPIGSFQAVKHLCAELLETSEAVTAAAWDVLQAAEDAADPGADPDAQWAYAADVAGVTCLPGAVAVAQGAIQVLGGIGFTFEHDIHLYLRRVMALRALLGGRDEYAVRLAQRAVDGDRRRVRIDFAGADDAIRAEVRDTVRAVAAAPEPERRTRLVEAGLVAPHWPAPYGRDAGPVEQLVIDQELEAAGVALPDLKIGTWALATLIAHGSAEQRERFVLPTLRGELDWCQLFSEPGAGSDLASLRTRAERVDGGWRLTGQKVWTSLAHRADWAICLARTDPDAARHAGISYFLVPMGSDGIEIRPLREMTGEAMFNEVFLDAVLVPDELVVGEVNDGWRLARATLANERVAMAGHRLGASTEQLVGLLARHGDEAGTARARIGERVAAATVGTLLGVRTTMRSLAGRGPGAESSVAKLLGVRNRQQASDLVVELLGERALLADQEASAMVQEALLTRCLSIAGGTTQVLRNVIGERILGLPR